MKIEIEAKEALEVIKELRSEADQLVQSLEKAVELTEKLDNRASAENGTENNGSDNLIVVLENRIKRSLETGGSYSGEDTAALIKTLVELKQRKTMEW